MTGASGRLLLDTNVVLQLARRNEIGRSIDEAYQLQRRPERPLISIVTVGELLAFARHRGWGEQRRALLEEIVRALVSIDINRASIDRCAEIRAFLVGAGKAVGDNDVWIAATAAATSSLLLTTDADFDPLDGTYLQLARIKLTRQGPSAT